MGLRLLGLVEAMAGHHWPKTISIVAAFPTAIIAAVLGGIDPAALTSSGSTATVTGMLAAVLIASLVHFRAENKRTDHNRDLSVIDARKEANDAREQLRLEREQWAGERRFFNRERERFEAERDEWHDDQIKLVSERNALRAELAACVIDRDSVRRELASLVTEFSNWKKDHP